MTINFLNTKTLQNIGSGNLLDPAVLDNISVVEPYFALKNLRELKEYIYTDFETELCLIDEHGPISGAEVGRHMAILGSVVLARENPRKEKHHYLATDAFITRCSNCISANKNLTARVKVLSFNRKKGMVCGEIFDGDGSVLYKIEVTYMILGKSIFERMFAQHRVETYFPDHFNPYTSDSEFFNVKIEMEACTASIGEIKPEHCLGHFMNYPALPVARMGTSMGKIGGIHFMHANPSEKKNYFIRSAELHARQLVFTGEEVKFRSEILDPKPETGMIIRVVAYNDQCDLIAESILHYHY